MDITNLCQAFHTLPRDGGIYDQDAYLVAGMRIVLNAQTKRQEKDKRENERKAKAKK